MPVQISEDPKKVFPPASMGAEPSEACTGKCLKVAGECPITSGHPVWTMSEGDKLFPGKTQVQVRWCFFDLCLKRCRFSRDLPCVDSCCDSFGVDLPRLSSTVSHGHRANNPEQLESPTPPKTQTNPNS